MKNEIVKQQMCWTQTCSRVQGYANSQGGPEGLRSFCGGANSKGGP